MRGQLSGKRGAIIVSFGSREDHKVAVDSGAVQGNSGGGEWSCLLGSAYSARSSSNEWHKIRTWHMERGVYFGAILCREIKCRSKFKGAGWYGSPPRGP